MLSESVTISKPVDEIFSWFLELEENYQTWHHQHIVARWIKGKKFEKGSVLYTEELMGGKVERLKFKTIKVIPNRLICFKLLFPESLICSGGTFRFDSENASTIFTATLNFKFEKLLAKIFGLKMEQIQRHMKEEGENLKAIMEGGENKNL